MIYVDNIVVVLLQFDLVGSGDYWVNVGCYKGQIVQIIVFICDCVCVLFEVWCWLVIFEGVFFYFVWDFGLNEFYLWLINVDVQGMLQQVCCVVDVIKQYQILVVFFESIVLDRLVWQIVVEIGVVYGGVLYVDSLLEMDGLVLIYLDLLWVIFEIIVDGLLNG